MEGAAARRAAYPECDRKAELPGACRPTEIGGPDRMRPKAEVIAYTKFRGVPFDVAHESDLGTMRMAELISEKRQDSGSDCARLIECAARECYDSYGKG